MLRRIPRQVWFINIYGYILVAVAVVLFALILLNSDSLTLIEVLALAGLVALFGLIWWRFHPRLSQNAPLNATALIRDVKHSHRYALLAFESEYCPFCMTMGGQVNKLENQPNLRIYRLSVNREPGRTLFRQYDGRVTPTYVLLDPRANVLQTWSMVLPVERVLYSVRQE